MFSGSERKFFWFSVERFVFIRTATHVVRHSIPTLHTSKIQRVVSTKITVVRLFFFKSTVTNAQSVIKTLHQLKNNNARQIIQFRDVYRNTALVAEGKLYPASSCLVAPSTILKGILIAFGMHNQY